MNFKKLPIYLAAGMTFLNATTGTNLVGYDTTTTAMAGSGSAMTSDLNLGTLNPALTSGNFFSVGIKDFMPKTRTNGEGTDDFINSVEEKNFIPNIGITYDIIPGVTSIGFNVYGTGEMGVDYSEESILASGNQFLSDAGTKQLKTSMSLAKFTVPIKLALNDYLTIGAAPVVQYGKFGVSYEKDNQIINPDLSKDYGAGYEFGAISDLHTKNIVLSMVYRSKIEMNYDNQLSVITKELGLNNGAGLSDIIEQPSEVVIGGTYTFYSDNIKSTFALDYKNIGYSEATGYKELGWQDQDVVSFGYEFDNQERLAIRLGYSHATNAIKELPASSFAEGDYQGAAANYLNLVAFPATTTSHFTAGIGYRFSDSIMVNAAYVYAPEVVSTFDTSAMTQKLTGDSTANSSVLTTASQSSASINLTYKF